MHTEILRGDVFFADLDPTMGCELGGVRPVLVLQNNTGNLHSPTTIVAAITCKKKPRLPTHVLLPGSAFLQEGSTALLEQVRTIDKTRLGDKAGTLDRAQMALIDAALMASLGIRDASREAMVMALCSSCVQSFRDSDGFLVRRADFRQEDREPCMMCNVRTGYDYEVTRL